MNGIKVIYDPHKDKYFYKIGTLITEYREIAEANLEFILAEMEYEQMLKHLYPFSYLRFKVKKLLNKLKGRA